MRLAGSQGNQRKRYTSLRASLTFQEAGGPAQLRNDKAKARAAEQYSSILTHSTELSLRSRRIFRMRQAPAVAELLTLKAGVFSRKRQELSFQRYARLPGPSELSFSVD